VHVRTPEQFERWSVVVATAMNHLVLARHLGQALYRPWERRREVVTPRQVRRIMPALLRASWDTNACAQTARKIAGLAQRDTSEATSALCGAQKTQAGAKNAPQRGLMALKSLSSVVPSDGSESVGQVVIV
jgi:hypothetical protein